MIYPIPSYPIPSHPIPAIHPSIHPSILLLARITTTASCVSVDRIQFCLRNKAQSSKVGRHNYSSLVGYTRPPHLTVSLYHCITAHSRLTSAAFALLDALPRIQRLYQEVIRAAAEAIRWNEGVYPTRRDGILRVRGPPHPAHRFYSFTRHTMIPTCALSSYYYSNRKTNPRITAMMTCESHLEIEMYT